MLLISTHIYCLDCLLDDAEGKICVCKTQVETISITLEKHEDILAGKHSKISNNSEHKNTNDNYVQRPTHIAVNISSSYAHVDESPDDQVMESGNIST